jgi:ubiquinone/menaquinone biosynthesis C-methylase UbiE
MVGMEHSYPSKLHVWEGWAKAADRELGTATLDQAFLGPYGPAEEADRLYADETLNHLQPVSRPVEGAEPYSLQWFLEIENQRHSRQGRWLPRLLEFAKHSGETLLGLGNGLGTDWLQYARHGASVVVCSASAEQLALARRNFELRGLSGRFLHGSPQSLPLENASIDVVCISSMLPEWSEPSAVVAQIYRVLKPGGKVLAVMPAKYDVQFWSRILFPWSVWLRGGTGERAAEIRFSARRLRGLFSSFVEHRVHKRQLRRRELPLGCRLLPLPLLERVMGRVLVLKAFKPLSAAILLAAAA